MGTDLCRGWSEMDLVRAWCGSTELQRAVLAYIAEHPGSSLSDIASGLDRSERSVQAALATWSRFITGRLGITDSEGRPSVPWRREWNSDKGSFVYRSPPRAAQVMRTLASSSAVLPRRGGPPKRKRPRRESVVVLEPLDEASA